MYMELKDFKISNLTGEEFNEFLEAIEGALSDAKYDEVKTVVDQITSDLNGKIVTVDENGRNITDIGTDTIDVMEVAVKLSELVNQDISAHHLSDETKREALVGSMDEILTGIFEQEKLQEELLARDFSIEEFKDQINAANQHSEEVIEEAKAEKRRKEHEFESLIGRDSIIKTGVYEQKSAWTKITDCKEAITMLTVAKDQIDQLNDLKSKTGSTPEEKASLDKKIKRAENNLKYLAEGIKTLNVKGVNNDIFVDWETDAKRGSVKTDIDTQLTAIENVQNGVYADLADKVGKLDSAAKTKFKISSELEDALSKITNASASAADKENARKKVDKYLTDIHMSINKEADEKIQEQRNLISVRKQSVQKYNEIASQEHNNNIESSVVQPELEEVEDEDTGEIVQRPKIVEVQAINEAGIPQYEEKEVQAEDSDGNPIYLDAEEENNPKMIKIPDYDKPIIEKIIEVKDIEDEDTRNHYLQTFNESKALEDIREDLNYYNGKEKDIKKELKKFLKENKIGTALSRFFAPRRVLKKHREKIEEKMLNERKNEYIKIEAGRELMNNPENSSGNRNAIQRIFDRIKIKAPMQHRLYEAGQAQAHRADKTKSAIDPNFIDSMNKVAYEELGYQLLSDEEKAKVKKESLTENVERHTNGVNMPAKDTRIMHNDER